MLALELKLELAFSHGHAWNAIKYRTFRTTII